MRYFAVLPHCEIHALFTAYTLSNITKTKTFHFKQLNIEEFIFIFIHIDISTNLVRLVWICGRVTGTGHYAWTSRRIQEAGTTTDAMA